MVRIKRPGKRRWGEGRGRGGTCCLIPPNSALTPSRSASIEVDMINRPSTTMQQLLQTDVSQNNNKVWRTNGGGTSVHSTTTPQQPRAFVHDITPFQQQLLLHTVPHSYNNSSSHRPERTADGATAWMAVEQSPRGPLGGGIRAAVRRRASLIIFSRDPASKLGGPPPPPSSLTHT